MDNPRALIEQYWQAHRDQLPDDIPAHLRQETPEAWAFGDRPEVADELGALVQAGVKTATCSLLWEYEAEGEALPRPGDLSIILDGQGRPIGLIQLTEVWISPFDQVSAQHAYEEGEGDRSLDYWREVHWRVNAPVCQRLGRQPAQDMPLVCQRFRKLF